MTARPDDATEWISPTGHTYVATPGVAILFPHWNITRLFRHRVRNATEIALDGDRPY